MPHGKRTTRNYELVVHLPCCFLSKELRDAIERIKQKPGYAEARTRFLKMTQQLKEIKKPQ